MDITPSSKKPRRYKGYVGKYGTSTIHRCSPWSVAWWSAAFPGFGHLLLCKYLRGYVLIIWEVFINIHSNVNLGIYYSFIGEFAKAKQVLDPNWLAFYSPVFIFGIWDSYRTAIEMNKIHLLADRENAEISPFRLSAHEINYLDKRTPWGAAAWSLLMPGMGQLYTNRTTLAFFLFVWWVAIAYLSHLGEAFMYSFLGEFEKVTSVVDLKWFLFIPSLYGFAMYDAYLSAVELNKLFEWEQARYLRMNYQPQQFRIPFQTSDEKRG